MPHPRLRVLLALLFLVAADALGAARARACSCVELSPEDALQQADAVFEGRVESFVAHNMTERATIHVTQAWKGVDTVEVIVEGPAQTSMCGVGFSAGGTYFVYANLEDGVLRTNMCMRTRAADHADEDRAAHGAGVVPVAVVNREPSSDPGGEDESDDDGRDDEPSEEDDAVDPGGEDPPPAARGSTGGCATCAAGDTQPASAWPLLFAFVLLRRRG